ncbi:MAG: Methylated-DNA--protein-cysteine methyltransferase, constitutive [candidate division WS2 bacterium]|uniref:Methylated-DNA--protein-cysteine methyltransferase n=1 Tax=Psychracetigena formicireducens TaxID=2986056 RepID=A0A9E2BGG5_PSYF1|nr:Methylated-DNA--protein-cysteine methyltransferase, constitutive [Candidatus Psychracetigena formicireducens]MBT9144457.1 Methylated-DNA--protein-cysteine methyltransferase, constitutive [Candidatus Psychracetigena formicireducens]
MSNSINNLVYYDFPWGKGELFFNSQDQLIKLNINLSISMIKNDGYVSPNSVKFIDELSWYFSGKKITFSIPINLNGCTAYYRKVYQTLTKSVTHGNTITYKELSFLAGGSPRSIGQAMKGNPMAIVIPCHRVVGSSGLGGFSGGLDIKQFLINLERRD